MTPWTSSFRCLTKAVVLAPAIALLGCSHYSPNDPKLQPFSDMYAVNRDQYGFGALPKDARVFIDKADFSSDGYDVMLRFYAKANHFVAFRLEAGKYKWVGELEQCYGPREYRSADGNRHTEEVDISYFQHVRAKQEGLHVSYVGPSSYTDQEISIARGRQLLNEWKCDQR